MPSATQIAESSVISPRSADAIRPLKVIVIGAGISGIIAGIRLPRKLEKLDLVIYDKNEEVGGTWFENKYPGCACDIPAHTYQLTFEQNPSWSTFYAGAKEILEYWKKIVKKYDLRKFMKLSHKVQECRWNEQTSKWVVKVQNLESGEVVKDTADAIMQCIGGLNNWRWPDLPGLHDFEGKLLHSANWDVSFDPKGKTIAVIGAGSSGIQIVPSLQRESGTKIDHYIRGATWISETLAGSEVIARGRDSNFTYPQKEIEEWKRDPSLYLAYRRKIEVELQSGHPVTIRGTEMQTNAREAFTKLMKERLAKKSHLSEWLIPDFPPVCKRLTPGPGYLESLTEDNVDVIRTKVDRVTSTGIRTDDGVDRKVDAIVCATGFDTTYRNRFPVIGINDTNFQDRWEEYPQTYMSLAVDGFPNYFMSLGPNSAMGSGNFMLLFESLVEFAAKAMRKMQVENILSMQPSTRSVRNFVQFCHEYFKTTVYSLECSSWYKGGKKDGPVVALWPGSSLHAAHVLSNPRWEDWEYTYVDGKDFGWFGDGWSELDRHDTLDKTYYLADKFNMIDDPLVEDEEKDDLKREVDEAIGVNGNGCGHEDQDALATLSLASP